MEHETSNLVRRLSMKSIYNRRMETVRYRWPACQLTLDLKYSQLIQECKIKWKIMIQRDNTAYWKKYLSTWLSFTRVLGLGGLNITQNIKIWLSGSAMQGPWVSKAAWSYFHSEMRERNTLQRIFLGNETWMIPVSYFKTNYFLF